MSTPARSKTTIVAKPAPSSSATLAAIQRKLDRWELLHLRQHALDLAERLELRDAAITLANDALDSAQSQADYWHAQCQNLIDELKELGATVSLAQNGTLGVAA